MLHIYIFYLHKLFMHKKERTNFMIFKKALLCLLMTLLLVSMLCVPSFAVESKQNYNDTELYLGGMPFGAKITSNGLTVVKFSETQGKNASSAYQAGIREGDIITKINGNNIISIEDFVRNIDKSGGKEITITVIRKNQELKFNVTPKYSPDDGKYKTGVWVKDSTSGIGTITYIHPETGEFGGLGHGICDSSTGKTVPFTKGVVMDVTINGVVKGQIGTAGELKGCFNSNRIGKIIKNTDCGVFGILSAGVDMSASTLVKVCPKDRVCEGEAYMVCTLDESGPQKYRIEITNIDHSGAKTKNFRIKVTDPKLIEKAGGIVQGMSGSPIIQNGKLVGAVTHVLINDPTSGYGIFIENMLSTAKGL